MSSRRKWHGDYWTQRKLEKLLLYLSAFQDNMRHRPFKTVYVDACAGEGHVERWNPKRRISGPLYKTPPNISEGSTRRALGIDRPFDKYVFIEVDKKRFRKLWGVRQDFPELRNRISLRRWDANNYVPKLCGETDWSAWRGVFFLDPAGTHIRWETVRAIAHTGAADLWYLFPVGQTVNRFMRCDRDEIEDSERKALDRMFGATDWYEKFYRTRIIGEFFPERKTLKVGSYREIINYFVGRLKVAFPHVVDWPLRLVNRTAVPLFALCFASPSRRRTEMAREVLRSPSSPLLQ